MNQHNLCLSSILKLYLAVEEPTLMETQKPDTIQTIQHLQDQMSIFIVRRPEAYHGERISIEKLTQILTRVAINKREPAVLPF